MIQPNRKTNLPMKYLTVVNWRYKLSRAFWKAQSARESRLKWNCDGQFSKKDTLVCTVLGIEWHKGKENKNECEFIPRSRECDWFYAKHMPSRSIIFMYWIKQLNWHLIKHTAKYIRLKISCHKVQQTCPNFMENLASSIWPSIWSSIWPRVLLSIWPSHMTNQMAVHIK